jgi:cardiolipin synthase
MPARNAPPVPSSALLTLPNVISFARLCAVPVAIYLVLWRQWGFAFGLFAAAGISDAVDGWLARRQGGSALGAALDPLADKTLMVGMYVTLAAIGALPSWIAILSVFRDIVIVGGVLLLWMYGHGAAIRPIFISKLNTALQIALVGLVLGMNAAGIAFNPVREAAIWLVAASTLASLGTYVYRTVRPA